jgi:AcrR family transcriptional regulator
MAARIEKASDQQSSGSGRPYRRKAPDQRRAERRARLEAAAVELYGTHGYAQTSIEQLCTAASVSTRTFYEEYPSRDALLAELHDQLNGRALDAVVTALAGVPTDSVAERAAAGCAAYFGVMTADARWARVALIESVGVSAELEAHRQAAVDRFAAVLTAEGRRLADAGLLPDRDYALTAVAIVGAIKELVMMWARRPRQASVAQVAQEATRVVVAAMASKR